jgi:hemoglobin
MEAAMSDPKSIDEASLAALVACFYAKVRADTQLAPVFERAVTDWPDHLDKLSAFWSSVMLTSGRYKGNPMAAHVLQAPHITPDMFARWLALWSEATAETMPPAAAAALQAKAARIASSLKNAIALRAGAPVAPVSAPTIQRFAAADRVRPIERIAS